MLTLFNRTLRVWWIRTTDAAKGQVVSEGDRKYIIDIDGARRRLKRD
jgi:hypothetical protein